MVVSKMINGLLGPKYKDKRRDIISIVSRMCDVRTLRHTWAPGLVSVSQLAVYGFDETDNETPGRQLAIF